MNRLAIIEDNVDFARNLLNYIIKENKQIQLWSLSINGDEILGHLEELEEKDIILLDLGLPQINGIDLISKLVKKKNKVPYIIVMSGNTNLVRQLRQYERYIYALIEKPFAFKRILAIIEQITYSETKNNFKKIAEEELKQFEINTITVGYRYILESIIYSLEDATLLKDMKNMLYKKISLHHNCVSTLNVKWTIEKSIGSIRRYTSSELMNTYFHLSKKERLTPKLFISTIVSNLRETIEKEAQRKELISK